MAIMQALALLAGGAVGRNDKIKEDEEAARQKENDAWTREQRQRQRQKWTQEDQDRADAQAEKGRMVKAAAPVEATPELTPDQAGPQTWQVSGKTIADPGKVDTAVRAENMPSAVMTRMAGATSDPTAAVNLRTGAAKAKTDEDAQGRQEKIRDIVGTLASGGVNAIPEIYARYNDGFEAQVIPGQNGGFTVRRMKDGQPAGDVPFKDMEDFIVRAVGSMNPDLYVSSMQKRREQEQAQANADRTHKLAQTNAERQATHETRMLTAAQRTASAAERKAAGDGAAGLTLADLKDGHKTIASTLNADYKSQIDLAPDEKTGKAIKTTREAEIADVQRLYTGAMTQGVVLTPEQAIAAFRTGKRVQVEVPDDEGKMHRVEAMQVGQRIIPFAEAPGKFVEAKAGGKPAPAPAQPQAPKPAAAPAAPAAGGGRMQSAAGGHSDKTLAGIEQQAQAQVVALNDAVVQARAQLAAAAKSGDPTAAQSYAQALQRAVSARDAKAAELLGNGAQRFMATLPN